MKQWRCSVCDYIDKAESPADNCPVCGSESNLFVPAGEESETAASTDTTADAALRWQCVVCGYIHTGPEPPDKCPVCGADRSQFVCLDREAAEDTSPPESPSTERPDRKWRCTVCGYIHTGPQPPSECPVCGADQSMFEEVVEENVPVASSLAPAAGDDAKTDGRVGGVSGSSSAMPGMVARVNKVLDRYRRLIDLAIENHAHPISVHIPNGVLPIAVVMVLLASLFDSPALGRAGFYNMVFILLSMPVVLFTGYLHWQYKFGGHMTTLFKSKVISGAVVSAIAFILVIWALLDPQVAEKPTFIYIGLHLVMLGVAGYAGYLGGRLVFHRSP